MLKKILIPIVLIEFASTLLDHETFHRFKRQDQPSCGVPEKQTASMIINGDSFNRGAWPWMVALMSRDSMPPDFFCGGTLITSNVVVTAAHCIHHRNRNEAIKPKDVQLIFGAFNLQDQSEAGSFSLSPKKFIVHPDWKPFTTSLVGDIALIIPDDVVPYTKLIRPICLWESSTDSIPNEGFTAGWGLDSNDSSGAIPAQIKVKIHNGDQCDETSKSLVCGESRKDSGTCSGDSGSGIYVKHGKVFFLRALVSAGYVKVIWQGGIMKTVCDVNRYSTETNVPEYKEWINENIRIQSCGKMNAAKGMIQGGSHASLEMFPWTVAVFDSEVAPEAHGHLTTGTLVSSRHVVTEAGFVAHFDSNGKGTAYEVERYKMYFGAFNLDRKNEADVIPASVSKIIPHPNYKDGKPFESDVAILVADRTIEFSQRISPICLWPNQHNSDDIEGKLGFSAGWGYDDSKTYSTSKRYIQMKVNTSCRQWQHRLSNVTSSKYFCAKAVAKGTPCYGDEPFYVKSGDKWFLRGLRMRSFVYDNFTCDYKRQILYEDLALFSSWIKNQIES